MEKPKFRVGDKVRVKNGKGAYDEGKTGVIQSIDTNSFEGIRYNLSHWRGKESNADSWPERLLEKVPTEKKKQTKSKDSNLLSQVKKLLEENKELKSQNSILTKINSRNVKKLKSQENETETIHKLYISVCKRMDKLKLTVERF